MMVDKFEFAGTDYIIIDKFKHQGIEYIYILEDITEKLKGKDISNLKEEINAKADFVYECPDGMYENVVDDKLYGELIKLVNKRNMYGINEILNKYLGITE